MNSFFTIINMQKTKDISFSIITIVLGILFAIFSGGIVKIISILFGIGLLVITIFTLISRLYLLMIFTNTTTIPKLILQMALALVFILHSDIMVTIYPIVIALLLLAYALHRLEICRVNREQGIDVSLDTIYYRIGIVIAIVILLIPTSISSMIMGLLIGGALIISGLANLVLSYMQNRKNKSHSKYDTDDIIIEVK